MNDDCYLFVRKVAFCYAQRKVTITWQDSKTPNEIPLRAFAPLSAPQKFDYGLRPSLRMTRKCQACESKTLELTTVLDAKQRITFVCANVILIET